MRVGAAATLGKSMKRVIDRGKQGHANCIDPETPRIAFIRAASRTGLRLSLLHAVRPVFIGGLCQPEGLHQACDSAPSAPGGDDWKTPPFGQLSWQMRQRNGIFTSRY